MSGYSTRENGTNFYTIYTQYYYTDDQLIKCILVLNKWLSNHYVLILGTYTVFYVVLYLTVYFTTTFIYCLHRTSKS